MGVAFDNLPPCSGITVLVHHTGVP